MTRTLTSLLAICVAACVGLSACGNKEDKPKEPAAKKEEPAAKKKKKPAAKKEEPAAKPKEPAAKKEEPAAKKEEPAARKKEPAAKKEEPAANKEEPAAKKEEPAAKKEDPAATALADRMHKGDAELAGTELWEFFDPFASAAEEPPPPIVHHCADAAKKKTLELLTTVKEYELLPGDLQCKACDDKDLCATAGSWECRYNAGQFAEERWIFRPDANGALRTWAVLLEFGAIDPKEDPKDFKLQQETLDKLFAQMKAETCK